jgi:hypothetical protein
MKHLRRRIIIRQYDYTDMVKRAIPTWYHTSSFEPITLKELEQEYLLALLSEKKSQMLLAPSRYCPPNEQYYQYPQSYLWQMQNFLYDKNYVKWFSEYDEDGYMWIQARKNTPKTLLGWATFEYDY